MSFELKYPGSLAEKYPGKYWMDSAGKLHQYRCMSQSHIYNAIKMLEEQRFRPVYTAWCEWDEGRSYNFYLKVHVPQYRALVKQAAERGMFEGKFTGYERLKVDASKDAANDFEAYEEPQPVRGWVIARRRRKQV